MALMFELSGQHPDLPTQEVLGALEAEGARPDVLAQADGILVVKGRKVTPALAPVLASRLALTRKVSEFLYSCWPEKVVMEGRDIEVTFQVSIDHTNMYGGLQDDFPVSGNVKPIGQMGRVLRYARSLIPSEGH